MKANRGLRVGRMVELGGVSRASFYRFDETSSAKVDRDMDLRDTIQRIALKWPGYGRPRITAELKSALSEHSKQLAGLDGGAEPSAANHA